MKTTRKKVTISWIAVFAVMLSLLPQVGFANDTGDAAALHAAVSFVAQGETIATQSVTVPAEPEKDYIPQGTNDPLEGKASVYDAVLAALAQDNTGSINASWTQQYASMYISDIMIGGTEYSEAIYEAEQEGVYGEPDFYSKYSGAGWTYTIDGKSGGGASGEALTDNAEIVFTYAPYCYESGVYKVNMKFITSNGETIKENVLVPVYPEKDYIKTDKNPSGIPDKLEGKASVYDALRTAIGQENVNMRGTFITGITVDGTPYNSASDDAKLLCDFAFYYSSGKDWTYSVNDVFVSEYAPDQKLAYGDVIVFTYSPWHYITDMYTSGGYAMPYGIGSVMDQDGGGVTDDFTDVTDVYVTAVKFEEQAPAAKVILAAYDAEGVLLRTKITSLDELGVLDEKESDILTLPARTQKIKAFVWTADFSPVGSMRSAEQEGA